MKGSSEELKVELRYQSGATIVHPIGSLDITTYGSLRDTLLKCANEQPDVLLVEVSDLDMPSVHALAVFSSVATRTAEWPGVPLMLIADRDSKRAMLTASPIGRFVPVFSTVTAAFAAARQPPARSRAVIELPPAPVAGRRARYFVRSNCERWHVGSMANDAMTIATVFVENTLQHTNSMAFLRMELRRGLLTIAVSDDDPHPAVLRERAEGGVAASGLLLVAAVAKAWGCTPTMTGGKTVWATLRPPEHTVWVNRAGENTE